MIFDDWDWLQTIVFVLIGLVIAAVVAFIVYELTPPKLAGERQTAVIRIDGEEFRYEGQEALRDAFKRLDKDNFNHLVKDGVDYFIFAPGQKSNTTVMPVPVIIPSR